MPTIAVNGIIFHYEEAGDRQASPVVFISGYTGDVTQWQTVANALASTHRVIRFDNQGIGQTKDEGQVLTISNMAENIAAFLGELDVSHAILVGFAMGTNLAMQLAHDYPDLAAKLILLSPVLRWSEEAKERIDTLIHLREQNQVKKYYEKLYELAFGTTFKQETPIQVFTKDLTSFPPCQTLTDQKRQAAALKAFDASAWAKEIRLPVTVITPQEDLFALPADAEAVKQATGGELITLNYGHAILDESPDAVKNICVEECNLPLNSNHALT